MPKTIIASIAASIATSAIVAAAILFAFGGGGSLAGAYETIFTNFSAGLSIGEPGSNAAPKASKITFLKVGTCNPTFSGTSLAATSSGQFFCTGITGVASGDNVDIMLPRQSRISAAVYFDVVNAYATTTDRIGFDMENNTGAATTSFPLATTSVQYRVWRTSTNP